ncbi:MAG TPA: DUF5313 family protein [Mycobacteriales bacterium]|nr:DUF5313 family protein [Mycobacteriales bacterium]
MTRLPGDPGLLARLRYALGFRLRAHTDWVRHDLTDAGWRWRALRRLGVPLLPFCVLFALLPGPGYLRAVLPAFLIVTAGFITAAYAEDLRDYRLRQHGLRPAGRDDRPA